MTRGNQTHGHTKRIAPRQRGATPEYKTWCAMKARCHTPGSSGYAKYGAKGITVCDRWMNSFEAFFADMGTRPSPKHSIERDDVRAGYGPGNCRWATLIEQANNKTSNRFIELDGKSLTLAQWARQSGVNADVIALRIDKHGWEIRKAIFTAERSASSGLRGVYWQPKRRKWNVRFTSRGVLHDLGRFDTLLDAVSALKGNAGRTEEAGRMMKSILDGFDK